MANIEDAFRDVGPGGGIAGAVRAEGGQSIGEQLRQRAATAAAEASTAPDVVGKGLPDWAAVPAGTKIPSGAKVAFLRIPAEWTMSKRQDRLLVLSELSYGAEKLAKRRAVSNGDSDFTDDLAMQTIVAIDGAPARWGGGPGSVEEEWRTFGYKGRQAVRVTFLRTHQMSNEDINDFFAKHVAFGTAS